MKTAFRIPPPLQKLNELLSFDPNTGKFTRLQSVGNAKAGDMAGSIRPDGYYELSICGKTYLSHRIAWAMFYGEPPSESIDHINTDRSDNRIENLRLASKSQNGQNRGPNKNNKSGIKGVCWDTRVGKWLASITINRKQIHLGHFKDKDIAASAYLNAAALHHRDFGRLTQAK